MDFLNHITHIFEYSFVVLGTYNVYTATFTVCTFLKKVFFTLQMGKTRTNTGLKLRFGKNERVFRLEFVSNQSFGPSEFEKWRHTCEQQEVALPTREFVQNKAEDIKKGLTYEFSSSDIDNILKKKEKFLKFPVNYAMTKAKLMKDKEIAAAEHDNERVQELES